MVSCQGVHHVQFNAINNIFSVTDILKIRSDFPILESRVYGKPLVYLDNGATTQKPLKVINTIREAYTSLNSNIHRGVHALSDRASESYENARETVRRFINASKTEEIIFTPGSTGSINAIAFSFGERYVNRGDEIIVSEMEHHANIVPWQMMCERKGATLRVIPVNDDGTLELETYRSLISSKSRIVSVAHVSNALGTINPVEEIISIAHSNGIPVMIDGAQGIQHGGVDVQRLDCDFYVFSGHKVYGPTGIGIMYGKEKYLNEMPPYQGGGDMVDRVSFEKTTYNQLPFKFEAGTTNFIGAIGMAAALDYLTGIGISTINWHEKELLNYATERLGSIPGLRIYGTAPEKISIISFLIDKIHMYDAGMILDKMGIAVRTGTQCAQPLMTRYGIDGVIRASLCFYNTKEEIDALVNGILKVKEMME
ncbi:MAG: cysteine desulfurase [Bacteroidia bacterium]|nr:MAG: cysteine desulfurase [Bacteroidia bacterium]